MKTYDEIAKSIIKKYNMKLERKKRISAIVYRAAFSVSGICAAVIICVFVFKNDYFLDISQKEDINKGEFHMTVQTEISTTEISSYPVTAPCTSTYNEDKPVRQTSSSCELMVTATDSPVHLTDPDPIVRENTNIFPSETVTTAAPIQETVQPEQPEYNRENTTAQNEDIPPASSAVTVSLETIRLENPNIGDISEIFPVISFDVDKTYEFLDSEVSADKLNSLIKATDIDTYDEKSAIIYIVTAYIYNISGEDNIIAVRFGESDKIYAYAESKTAGLYSNRVFSSLSFSCELYESQVSNISSEYIAEQLGEINISGENDLTGEQYNSACTVFAIKGISTAYAVAVRLEGSNNCMLYRNPFVKPETMGDMIESLNLSENLRSGSIYRYDENNNLINCGNIKTEDLFNSLLSAPSSVSLSFGTFPSADFIIDVDIPLLNMTERVVEVSENGYIRTNIIDSGAVFFVGEDNVQKLKDIFF